MELSDINEIVKAVKAVLKKGDQVLIVPVKDGVRIFQIKRKEIKY